MTPETLTRIFESLFRANGELVNVGNLDLYFWRQSESEQIRIITELYNAALSLSPIRLKQTIDETRPTYPFMTDVFSRTRFTSEDHWGTVKAIIWALADARSVDYKVLVDNVYQPIVPALVVEIYIEPILEPVVIPEEIISPILEPVTIEPVITEPGITEPVIIEPMIVEPVAEIVPIVDITEPVAPPVVYVHPGEDDRNLVAILAILAMMA